MNPAALKIKGSPSDVFNRGKSNQERKLTGIEFPGSGQERIPHCLEKKGIEGRKVGTRPSLSCSLHRISVEQYLRSLIWSSIGLKGYFVFSWVLVSLRNVTPSIPVNEGECGMLKSDLEDLGCAGLLERPWNLKNEDFIQQFVLIREGKLEQNNMFDTTIRDRPEEWTAGVWREIYDFQPGGSGLANRTELYIEGKFQNDADPKDGFPVRDCRDSRERRLLEFLVPIVHPDKPTRVTCTIGNTIFGALSGDRPVDWGKVFSKLVQRLVGAAGKAKPTPICPFLYHLYEYKGLLTEEEEIDYTTAKELNRYRISPERDEDSDSGVLCITGPEPLRAPTPINQVKRRNRFRKSNQIPRLSPPIRSRGEGSRPSSEGGRPLSPRPPSPRPLSSRPVSPRPASPQPERQQPEIQPAAEQPEEEGDKPWVRRPFDPVRESYKVVKSQYLVMKCFIEEISNFFDAEPAKVMDRIRTLSKPKDLTDLQARMDCMLKENAELRARVDEGDALRAENKELKNRMKEAKKEVKVARTEWDKSKEIAQKVCKFLGSPSDVLNKARLFDHGLKQPATESGVKMMRCMIDYNQKMEKTLKELRSLLKPTGEQPEQAGTPRAGPSTIPAPTASFVTPPPTRPDPLLQEPIPVLNTDEMANLQEWAEGGPEALATPTTRTGANPSPSPLPDWLARSNSIGWKNKRNEG